MAGCSVLDMKTAAVKHSATYDNKTVIVWDNGDVTDAIGRTWTNHRALSVGEALVIADVATLFDAAEMPVIVAAAHKLAKRGVLLPGDLSAAASLASERSGSRPADVARMPIVLSKADRREINKGSLREHVVNGCRRIHCPVCG